MINPKHSGYVGSVEKIKTLCHELARVKGEYQGVFAEAIRAVEALEPERSRKLSGFFERSTIKFPKSYQDLWFSGIIEIMRTVNNHAYFYGYEEYIDPLMVKWINQEPYHSESIEVIKCISEDYACVSLDEYYCYPSDEYLCAIGPESKESLRTAVVVANKNIAGNGGLGVLYQNSLSLDGENESSIIDYGEGAIFRFRSFAEMFFTWSFSGLVNGVHCPSQEELLKANKAYALIFKT